MAYLIDTQILILSLVLPNKLIKTVKNILEAESIFISQISFFEIAIKQKFGKMPDFDFSTDILAELLKQDGLNFLNLHNKHIQAYAEFHYCPITVIPSIGCC